MLRDRYPDRNARLLRSVLCKRQTDRPSVQQAGQVYSSAGQYSVQVYSGLVSTVYRCTVGWSVRAAPPAGRVRRLWRLWRRPSSSWTAGWSQASSTADPVQQQACSAVKAGPGWD